MPSIAQESQTVPPGKKRRRDDNNSSHHHQLQLYASLVTKTAIPGTNHHPIPSSHSGIFVDRSPDHDGLFPHQYHTSPLAGRKIIPLPAAKRRRTSVERETAEGEPMQRSPLSSPSHKQQQQQQHSKTTPRRSTTALMSRCHICFRKPTKKSDLDSFADCQGCGQRTCYVCMRECLGWGAPPPNHLRTADDQLSMTAAGTLLGTEETSFTMLDADAVVIAGEDGGGDGAIEERGGSRGDEGWARGGGHRQMVCSRCCVERGQDGDVVCLGCLPWSLRKRVSEWASLFEVDAKDGKDQSRGPPALRWDLFGEVSDNAHHHISVP
ncbi:hypothetical protein N656DRAFT_841820 [Canariomyces notabilis]|uniref:Uncharacterized protein n=1 Tax=Canariomyces notabilis TaxID=2074819 RepID=A0AAN6TKU6_9PEZI|nr:hypothetical protein N656DRAFT_841820 [Canariomyces arenarius]